MTILQDTSEISLTAAFKKGLSGGSVRNGALADTGFRSVLEAVEKTEFASANVSAKRGTGAAGSERTELKSSKRVDINAEVKRLDVNDGKRKARQDESENGEGTGNVGDETAHAAAEGLLLHGLNAEAEWVSARTEAEEAYIGKIAEISGYARKRLRRLCKSLG
jgi:hypothetical protein